MKIGVISDTHRNGADHTLERISNTIFRDVEMVLHAGDLTSLAVLDAFGQRDVIAVSGNNDPPEVRRRLPMQKIIRVNGFSIGLIHGWGWPWGLQKRVRPLFNEIDCLVYGHSHRALNQQKNGFLYFNPGAYSGGFFPLWRRSVGILTIDRSIRGEIIRI
ncbi:MAG: metallophosphoesterase family protein [Pseudomonadota bacterium]